MTQRELFDIINAKYHFTSDPSKNELSRIYEEVYLLLKNERMPSDEKFLEILERNLRNQQRMALYSLDMSDSTSIIKRIINKIRNERK